MERFPRRPRAVLAVVPLLAAALAVAGCGDGDLTGTVQVAGSSTLLPFVSGVAGTFAGENPLTRATVEMTGTSAGMSALCSGTVDVIGASREMSDREKAECTRSGVRWVRLTVAHDALVFFTRKGSKAPKCVTEGDVYAVAGPEASGDALWSDGIPLARAMGSRTALPRTPIVVVAPGAASGTRQLVVEKVISRTAVARGVDEDIRPDAVEVPSDQVMLGEVLKSPSALAFAGFATVQPWADSVRAIAFDAGSGCVLPTPETVRAGTYPLSRPLYLYVNVDAAQAKPTVAAFTTALVDTADTTASDLGVIGLNPDEADRSADAWGDALGGGETSGT